MKMVVRTHGTIRMKLRKRHSTMRQMCKPTEVSGSSQTPYIMTANISKIGMVPIESINPVIPIVEMYPNI